MEKVRVLVVDDSPFSCSIISDALTEGGFEVVGTANSLEEAVEQYRRHRPDVVTMDIVMPGADGLECIRVLRVEDPNLKVIIISSMKDDELIQEARKLHVAGYLQKPLDNEALIAAINRIMAPDEIFKLLDSMYLDAFKDALANTMTKIAKTLTEFGDSKTVTAVQYRSLGVAVVVGIVGRYSGRMILDLAPQSAEELARVVLKRDPKNQDEILATVGELANIICGNACSALNRKHREFGLRVTPPSIFHGTSSEVSSPNVESKLVNAQTSFGQIILDIGFQRGVEAWT